MSLTAKGRTTDGSEFDGTEDGVDRVVPGTLSGNQRYHLTSVVFSSPAGTIANLEIILWDVTRNERAGKIGGSASSEQTWGTDYRVPVDEAGISNEVRVITTTQSVHLAKLKIEGRVAE